MSSVRWNLSSSPPPQSKSHSSWQKQRRANMFLHRNKKQLLEWDSSIFMSPAQVHVCSGTSLALQVLGCLCLQEWRKLNCSRKIFQPLCPCPWGCPKCSVSMGKGSFWCPQGNTNAAEPGWGRWVSTQGRHLSSFFLLQVEFRCFQRPRNSSKWPEFYILRLGIFKRGTSWMSSKRLSQTQTCWVRRRSKTGILFFSLISFLKPLVRKQEACFLSSLLLSDFSAGREGVFCFCSYSLLWLRTVHTSKWLPLHNKLEATWKKKMEKLQFLGSSKTYAPKSLCLYIGYYFQLPRNYMYISVFSKAHCVCCWQEALWLQNTAK